MKIYHNDAEVKACLDHLPDCGFNVLNWGKQTDIAEVKERVGDRMCLMGNVNPLEVGVRGTPEEVRAATLDVLEKGGGDGMILSVGGGTSPGMPQAEHPGDAEGAGGIQLEEGDGMSGACLDLHKILSAADPELDATEA